MVKFSVGRVYQTVNNCKFLFLSSSDPTCPECQSIFVVEIKESPRAQSIERVGQYLQQNSKFLENSDKRPMMNDNSAPQSSIGMFQNFFFLIISFLCLDFVDSTERLLVWCLVKSGVYFYRRYRRYSVLLWWRSKKANWILKLLENSNYYPMICQICVCYNRDALNQWNTILETSVHVQIDS